MFFVVAETTLPSLPAYTICDQIQATRVVDENIGRPQFNAVLVNNFLRTSMHLVCLLIPSFDGQRYF